MLNYDDWLTLCMPDRSEKVSTMFWSNNSRVKSLESTTVIYENDNLKFIKDLDSSNAIAFIILDKKTGDKKLLMSHDGDSYEITQNEKYFIQYRMHITSNTYQTTTFLSVYDLNTGKLVKRNTASDLNQNLSKDPTDREWFSIYIDSIREGNLNFYDENQHAVIVPIKQCLSGPDKECLKLDPFILNIN